MAITMTCGPMFSGKSRYLKAQIERKTRGNKKVLVIRPKKDTRSYFTHDDEFAPEESDSEYPYFYEKYPGQVSEKTLSQFTAKECQEFVDNYDAIFVDEYFLIKDCKVLAQTVTSDENDHCDIYFAGLIATSENETWKQFTELAPYCDDIIKLNAVCTECGSEHGNYSMYIGGNKSSKVVIGDIAYRSVCRRCYKKLVGFENKNKE